LRFESRCLAVPRVTMLRCEYPPFVFLRIYLSVI
jgi:hypothetical protein